MRTSKRPYFCPSYDNDWHEATEPVYEVHNWTAYDTTHEVTIVKWKFENTFDRLEIGAKS